MFEFRESWFFFHFCDHYFNINEMKFQYTTQIHYDRLIKYLNKTGASKEITINC